MVFGSLRSVRPPEPLAPVAETQRGHSERDAKRPCGEKEVQNMDGRIVAWRLNMRVVMDTFAATPTTTAHRLLMYAAHESHEDAQQGDMGIALRRAVQLEARRIHARLPASMVRTRC